MDEKKNSKKEKSLWEFIKKIALTNTASKSKIDYESI